MKTTNKFKPSEENDTPEGSVEMTISATGAAHLMSTLTNLYSNAPLAVVREITSNALDATLKSGSTRPIEVHFTADSLIVKDYGVGLNRDDITNVYSQYGASTKRADNLQIGAFGLGAKSPLAVADRFDVLTNKDGVQLAFSVVKNSKGVGVVHFISEIPTQEPNGTTVSILSSQFAEVDIQEFFVTWDPAIFILKNPAFIASQSVYSNKFLHLTEGEDSLGWVTNHAFDVIHGRYSADTNVRFSIVIAGIRYDMPLSPYCIYPDGSFMTMLSPKARAYVDRLQASGVSLFVNMPIGSLQLVPSRENIMLNKENAEIISNRIETIEVAAVTLAKMLINRAKTPLEAYMTMNNYLSFLDVPRQETHRGGYSPFFPVAPVKEKNGNLSYNFSYKGDIIPIDLHIGNKKVHMFGAANASVWQTKTPVISDTLPLLGILRDYDYSTYVRVPRDKHYTGHSPYSNTADSLVVYGKVTEDNMELARRNSRDFLKGKGYSSYPTLFFIDSEKKPHIPWLETYDRFLSLDELLVEAKKARSIRSKEAAARRAEKNVVRRTSEHIGFDPYTSTFKKYSSDDFGNYDNIIALDYRLHNSYAPAFDESARHILWEAINEVFSGTQYRKRELTQFTPILSQLFSTDDETNLVIFVPNGRRVTRVEKEAGDKFVPIDTYIANRLDKLTVEQQETVGFMTSMLTNLNSATSSRVFSALAVQDYQNKVLDGAVKAFYQRNELHCIAYSILVLATFESDYVLNDRASKKETLTDTENLRLLSSDKIRAFVIDNRATELREIFNYVSVSSADKAASPFTDHVFTKLVDTITAKV